MAEQSEQSLHDRLLQGADSQGYEDYSSLYAIAAALTADPQLAADLVSWLANVDDE